MIPSLTTSLLCLKQVTSRKDQEQYWSNRSREYRYIPVSEFAKRFKRFHVGLRLENELSVPYDKNRSHKAALVFKKYSIPKSELLRANFDKEWLLIRRNSFVYVFKSVQIFIVAIITATVFLRTQMRTRNEQDGAVYIGALLFTLISNTFNGFSELALTIQRLPVFYKQRDLLFHPPWAYTLPTFLLRIPISIFEAIVWMVTTYYTIGFTPEPSRYKFPSATLLLQQYLCKLTIKFKLTITYAGSSSNYCWYFLFSKWLLVYSGL